MASSRPTYDPFACEADGLFGPADAEPLEPSSTSLPDDDSPRARARGLKQLQDLLAALARLSHAGGEARLWNPLAQRYFECDETEEFSATPHTIDHENRLLREAGPHRLPSGRVVRMRPCSEGADCVGMRPALTGHGESGGVVLREMLTPSELSAFESSGRLPEEPTRPCVLCYRLRVQRALCEIENGPAAGRRPAFVVNSFCNAVDEPGGYQRDLCLPAPNSSAAGAMVGMVCGLHIKRLKLVRDPATSVWWVDQRGLAWTPEATLRLAKRTLEDDTVLALPSATGKRKRDFQKP